MKDITDKITELGNKSTNFSNMKPEDQEVVAKRDNNTQNADIVAGMASGEYTDAGMVILALSKSDNQTVSYDSAVNAMVKFGLADKKSIAILESFRCSDDLIGFYPKSAEELVHGFIAKFNIEFDVNGNIVAHEVPNEFSEKHRLDVIKYEDRLEALLEDPEKSTWKDDIDAYERKIRVSKNLEQIAMGELTQVDLERKLYITRDKIKAKFSDSSIRHAVEEYIDTRKKEIRAECFENITTDSPWAKDEAEEHWNKIADLFNTTELSKEATIAVLKKFVWSVKRKMSGLPVTNHIMPVIIGRQGSGKTTFVEKLLEPVKNVKVGASMEELSDNRNIQLFSNNVIFLDEMSRAQKADIETVKNVITSNKITRRVLGTNITQTVSQQATFIGCSNKNLDQVISDETGIRRFIPLQFKNIPNWNSIDDVRFANLWKSVNEHAGDPSEFYFDEISEVQAQYRTKSTCEDWISSLNRLDTGDKYKDGRKWYIKFQEYEEVYFPHRNTAYSTWDREMSRLSLQSPELGFSMTHGSNGIRYYRYSWEEAHGIPSDIDQKDIQIEGQEKSMEEEIDSEVSENNFLDKDKNVIPEVKELIEMDKEEARRKAIIEEEKETFEEIVKQVESIAVNKRNIRQKAILNEKKKRCIGYYSTFEEIAEGIIKNESLDNMKSVCDKIEDQVTIKVLNDIIDSVVKKKEEEIKANTKSGMDIIIALKKKRGIA